MPSVAHPGNQNNVQWLWILYTPEIYCWTLIDTAQRSPSINKPPSLYNQSSGLSDPSFLTMCSRCSVVALSTQWKPKPCYNAFLLHKIQQKRLTNLFINYLPIVNVRWLSSSVKARPFLMSYQNEMFSQSTCTKSHKNITIAFNIPSRKTNHLHHYFVTSLKFLLNFVFKRFPNRLFLRRGKIGCLRIQDQPIACRRGGTRWNH